MSQSNLVAPPAPGSDDVTDYDRRLPHAKPQDTLRGLYFNAVFSAVKLAGGDQAVRQHHELVNDPKLLRSYIDFSNYPVVDFLRIASAATRVMAPLVGGQANAQRYIGKQGADNFMYSMFGKTLMLLSGNTPGKALATLPAGYNTSTNWGGNHTVTMLSNNSARVSLRNNLLPPFQVEGILLAIMKSTNAKNPQITMIPRGVLDADYDVTWE